MSSLDDMKNDNFLPIKLLNFDQRDLSIKTQCEIVKSFINSPNFFRDMSHVCRYLHEQWKQCTDTIIEDFIMRFNLVDWEIATLYDAIWTHHFNQGNDEKTIKYYEKALPIMEELKRKRLPYIYKWLWRSYGNIDEEDSSKALEYYKKALPLLLQEPQDNYKLIEIYNSLWHCCLEQQNYSEAIIYYQQALPLVDYLDCPERDLFFGFLNGSLSFCYEQTNKDE